MENQKIVKVKSFNKKGIGIASFEANAISYQVEIPFSVPEDELLVELKKKRRRVYQSELKAVLNASLSRVQAKCFHAPECGGCSFQQVLYERQLLEKQSIVEKAFCFLESKNIISPILACAHLWEYRNKMEFSFSQDRKGQKYLGLMLRGSRGKVLNLQECHLTSSWFIKILQEVRKWWENSGLEAYHAPSDKGTLRTLILREGKRTGYKLVMLTVSGSPSFAPKKSHIGAFVETIKSLFSEKEQKNLSIFLRVQQLVKGQPTQFYEMHLYGPDHILEQLQIENNNFTCRTLTFKLSPTAFFQPNPFQAEKLFSKVLEILKTHKRSHILDLYAGTATLGIILSHLAKKVSAIELNPHAVFDAQASKELNRIENLEIYRGDVAEVLGKISLESSFLKPDLIVVDPPRSGLDKKALKLLLELCPKEILYISCNPYTQAENIKELLHGGYKLVCLQPVDQFPHTIHIETIAYLQKDF